MHVLIIEDQPAMAKLIGDLLRELGFDQIEIVASEGAAVAAATHSCPDLVTVDERIIGGSGVEAVLRICAAQPLPVIFVVANPWDIRLSLPDAVILEKPFTYAELAAALAAARASPLIVNTGLPGERPAQAVSIGDHGYPGGVEGEVGAPHDSE